MIATVINALAVLFGSLIGLVLKGRIHDKYEQTVFTALGIFTFVLGFTMAQESCNALYMVFSLVLGGLLGTWIGVEDMILRFGEWMKSKLPVPWVRGSSLWDFWMRVSCSVSVP